MFTKKNGTSEIIQKKKEEPKKHTIMIVDDEQSQLDALTSFLADEYEIIASISGERALEMIDGMKHPGKISLIISDFKMPVLSGIEFFDKLKYKNLKAVRIIHTAVEIDNIIDSSPDYRKENYQIIQKGLKPEELKHQIRQAIEFFEKNEKSISDFNLSN